MRAQIPCITPCLNSIVSFAFSNSLEYELIFNKVKNKMNIIIFFISISIVTIINLSTYLSQRFYSLNHGASGEVISPSGGLE